MAYTNLYSHEYFRDTIIDISLFNFINENNWNVKEWLMDSFLMDSFKKILSLRIKSFYITKNAYIKVLNNILPKTKCIYDMIVVKISNI